MKSMSYNLQDRISHRIKRQQYKNMLDDQLKQKHSYDGQRRRLDTEPVTNIRSSAFQSPNYSTPNSKNRKFIEHSTFLPAIGIRNRSSSYRPEHRREFSDDVYFYENNGSMNDDTEYETIQYLGECERIIGNLKKLANASTKRIIRQSKKLGYGNMEGSRLYTDPAEPDFHSNQHAYMRHKDHNAAEREIQHMGVPESPYHPSHRRSSRAHGQAQYIGSIHKNDRRQSQNKDRGYSNEFDDVSEFNEGSRNTHRYQQQQQEEQEQSSKNNNHKNAKNNIMIQESQKKNNKNQTGNEQQQTQEDKQKQRLKKRNQFMLKFLGQAKLRGNNLQEKVAKHKLKFISPNKNRSRNTNFQQKNQECQENAEPSRMEDANDEVQEGKNNIKIQKNRKEHNDQSQESMDKISSNSKSGESVEQGKEKNQQNQKQQSSQQKKSSSQKKQKQSNKGQEPNDDDQSHALKSQKSSKKNNEIRKLDQECSQQNLKNQPQQQQQQQKKEVLKSNNSEKDKKETEQQLKSNDQENQTSKQKSNQQKTSQKASEQIKKVQK